MELKSSLRKRSKQRIFMGLIKMIKNSFSRAFCQRRSMSIDALMSLMIFPWKVRVKLNKLASLNNDMMPMVVSVSA